MLKLILSFLASIAIDSNGISKKLLSSNVKNEMLVSPQYFFYDLDYRTFLKIIFFILVSFQALNEGIQLREVIHKFGVLKGIQLYIWSFETVLNVFIIVISLFHLSTVAYNYFILSKLSRKLIELESTYFSLDSALNLEKNIQLQCNLMIFASFLQALNLLKFNPKTYLITDTLHSSSVDLAFLIPFVLINYCITGLMGHGLFYVDPQFQTLLDAVHTSILSIVRHIDFDLLSERKFFSLFSWQIFVWFYIQRTLINFIISIIIANFNQVRSSHRKTKTEKTFSRIATNALQYFNFK